MANQVELASLDLRYESFWLKQPALEQRLLSSILQRGIEEPLEGVEVQQTQVLLNGRQSIISAAHHARPNRPQLSPA
jgi:hypothetical protein